MKLKTILFLLIAVCNLGLQTAWAQGNEGEGKKEKAVPIGQLPNGTTDLEKADDAKKERPNQLNVFKVNLSKFAINEARFLYEIEIRPRSSLEFGAGYIYPNSYWYKQGGPQVLAQGFGLYASFRKYSSGKNVIYTPFLKTYLSPLIFYRYSTYENEWLVLEGAVPDWSYCSRYSEKIHQLAGVLRMGWQTVQGRMVMDIYGGIGVKYQPSQLILNAHNDSTTVCEILPDTDLSVVSRDLSPVTIFFNLGLKVGVRMNNRERNYEARGIKEEGPVRHEEAPIY